MAINNMPTELSSIIQDYARPHPLWLLYKENYAKVIKQVARGGEAVRYDCKDSMVWGPWVNRITDWDWDIMISNRVAPAWLIEEEGDYIQDEFLGMNLSENIMCGVRDGYYTEVDDE